MTTEQPDLYAILGVARSATAAEISQAYRSLLRRHHPDTRALNNGSEGALSDTTLQRILAAYRVLHDAARRAEYDRETGPRPQAHRRALEPTNRSDDYERPPTIAGPVRWHRVPDPPSA